MKEDWRARFDGWLVVHANDSTDTRRGRLLIYFVLGTLTCVVLVAMVDGVRWLIAPTFPNWTYTSSSETLWLKLIVTGLSIAVDTVPRQVVNDQLRPASRGATPT